MIVLFIQGYDSFVQYRLMGTGCGEVTHGRKKYLMGGHACVSVVISPENGLVNWASLGLSLS